MNLLTKLHKFKLHIWLIFFLNHTIRRVKLLSKNSTYFYKKKTTFSRVFHPKFFWQIFSLKLKSKLSIAKKSKTTTFSRVFLPKKKSTTFSGNQSWIFGQKMKISNSVFQFIFDKKIKSNFWTVLNLHFRLVNLMYAK